jgi:SET domain-containing protein
MKLGRGVYAARRLRKNQTIGEITGKVIDDPDYGSEYCIDLGESRNLEPISPFRFLNHSCEPNCEIFSWDPRPGEPPSVSDRLFLSAMRTIQPGEELTIDYGWPADAAIRCHCGTDKCRGWVVSEAELADVLRREKRKKKPSKRAKAKA